MSNASLQEQLQALSLGTTPAASVSEKSASEKKIMPQQKQPPHIEKHSAYKPQDKSGKQKPAWLEYAQYGVELLKAHFPLCFKENKNIQPLKVGIKQDLVKLLSSREDIVMTDKACMVSSLAYYVNAAGYHKTMVAGTTRINLNGEAEGIVTPEEANYSIECRKAKLEKKKVPYAHNKSVQPKITEKADS